MLDACHILARKYSHLVMADFDALGKSDPLPTENVMAIKWKKHFDPDPILNKIDKIRSVSKDGAVSFSGFDIQEQMPILSSMLQFPDSAESLNKSALIWSALAQPKAIVDRFSFQTAINELLDRELSVAIRPYALLTSLSIGAKGVPRSLAVLGTTIEFFPGGMPRAFARGRTDARTHKIPIPDTPPNYLQVRVRLRAKLPQSAARQGIDSVDLLRGLLALNANFAMEFSLGGDTFEPINVIRCGGVHTIHEPSGRLAVDAIWFEPNFKEAKIHVLKYPDDLFRLVRLKLKRISSSPCQKSLITALVRYARALDEPDPSTAFIKLWSALESLMSPGHGDYAKVVRRCAFLYTESFYHRQVLGHLREYRNATIHSGMDSEDARTNCFILQEYFRTAVNFYIATSRIFTSLDMAHEFLDLSPKREVLEQEMKARRTAIKFIEPRSRD